MLIQHRDGPVGERRHARRKRAVATSAVCAASLLAAAFASSASAAANWSVADPPFTTPLGVNVPFAPLYGISAISASDVWAVGEVSSAPLTENWSGRNWSSVALPAGPCSAFESDCVLIGVSGDSPRDVIAVGDGIINSESAAGWVATPLAFHYNGQAWAAMTLPSGLPYNALERVAVFSPSDAWAVGIGSSGNATTALALLWNGSTWTVAPTPISTTNDLTINAISGSSASDIWVVGETVTPGYHNRQFTSVIMHYNGSSWTQASVPDQSGLLDVDALSPTDAWAIAADGSVLNWNGSTWTVQTQESGAQQVAVLSPTDVWVGGIVSLGHYNGSAWSTTTAPSGINELYGSAALPPGRAWFAGISYESNGEELPAVLSTSNG
ncbi:MAG: hypothetical protein ACLP8S_04135 [Solirubrobacteraceae bacterium]